VLSIYIVIALSRVTMGLIKTARNRIRSWQRFKFCIITLSLLLCLAGFNLLVFAVLLCTWLYDSSLSNYECIPTDSQSIIVLWSLCVVSVVASVYCIINAGKVRDYVRLYWRVLNIDIDEEALERIIGRRIEREGRTTSIESELHQLSFLISELLDQNIRRLETQRTERGLSIDMINSLLRRPVKEEEHLTKNCSICLEDFEIKDSDIITELPECKHVFHHECIKKWLLLDRHCPYCRREAHTEICN